MKSDFEPRRRGGAEGTTGGTLTSDSVGSGTLTTTSLQTQRLWLEWFRARESPVRLHASAPPWFIIHLVRFLPPERPRAGDDDVGDAGEAEEAAVEGHVIVDGVGPVALVVLTVVARALPVHLVHLPRGLRGLDP